eukprot:CAMPEP_0202892112 /NCGR_PEP_ID=MMETSP1392-20130828/1936_1 /ASSEMBLY_ACC=CAM_ASM_000868 /TAXON_ID=225041 /ORGANISM="Chlamydomonas chlamydogama, Strain SAG 11-48b" /LENGTH=234 /DNA_ID=CAMNT_0049575993 /DNA_START=171 /DNA_END=872 /DNA_ORIENTATION=+
MSALSSAFRRVWRRIDKFLSVEVNPDPIVLNSFKHQNDIDKWRVFTDATFGGTSQATLQLGDDGKSAVFSGHYSKILQDGSSLVRSGYCGINQVRRRNVNLALHDYLEFRVRGDGHTYIASVRLDQYTGGDEEAWQAPIRTSSNGQWEDVRINFDDFIFTFRGRLVKRTDAYSTMPRHNVMAVGITLSASDDMPPEGDFRLELQHVVAGAYQLSGLEAQRKAFRGMYFFAEGVP